MVKNVCPYCKHNVKADSGICPRCGKQIPHSGVAEVEKEESGSTVNGDYRYSYNYSYKTYVRKKRGLFIGFISFVTGILLIGVAAIMVIIS